MKRYIKQLRVLELKTTVFSIRFSRYVLGLDLLSMYVSTLHRNR